MIEYRNVKKVYGDKVIIEDLNLKIEKGQFVSLIGSSGCGKTTTLKMLNGLIPLSGGEILINGENIQSYNPDELRRGIGYVIQSIGLFPNMTVEQNIGVVPELLKWEKEKIKERVVELMTMVNMPYEEYGKKFPNQLSGGQQQRIGVLRALAADPDIILMDEPFGALDPITRDIMQVEIRALQKKLGKTVVFVTHDMNEAIKLSDEIVFMAEGKILQKASPQEMLTNPANETVRDFLGLHASDSLKNNKELLCKDVMRTPVLTANIKTSLRECVWLMRENSIDTLILTNDEEVYKGVVEIESILKEGKQGMIAEELLNTDHPVVYETDTAKNAFDILLEGTLSFLVVLSKDKNPVGIVTRTGISKSMASFIWGEDDE